MVVAMESIAADVGVNVLKNGGNAVDAAVAAGFAIRDTSLRWQPRRRRLHVNPPGQRTHNIYRLSRKGPGKRFARYVSRRERQSYAGQHRGLAFLRRPGHGSWL